MFYTTHSFVFSWFLIVLCIFTGGWGAPAPRTDPTQFCCWRTKEDSRFGPHCCGRWNYPVLGVFLFPLECEVWGVKWTWIFPSPWISPSRRTFPRRDSGLDNIWSSGCWFFWRAPLPMPGLSHQWRTLHPVHYSCLPHFLQALQSLVEKMITRVLLQGLLCLPEQNWLFEDLRVRAFLFTFFHQANWFLFFFLYLLVQVAWPNISWLCNYLAAHPQFFPTGLWLCL